MDDEAIEQRVLACLDALGASYDTIRIDPQLADTADFCARYGYPLDRSANCIVVASKAGAPRVAACVNLATTRLDVNHTVRRRLGARKLSFASPDDTVALTGMRIGGVTPFGLPDGIPVLVDAAVVEQQRVIVGGGSRALKLLVDADALRRLPGAEVVEGLATT